MTSGPSEHLPPEPALQAQPEPPEGAVRALLAATDEGLLVIGPDRRIAAWNRRLAELLRVPEELLQQRSTEALELAIRAQAEVGPGPSLPDSTQPPSEVLRYLDGHAVERSYVDTDGAGVGSVWLYRDVSERERLRERLHDFQERVDDFYAHTPVMLHSIDAEGRLRSVSDEWVRRLGYSRSEVIGRRSVEFLTPESRRFAQEVVLPAFFQTGSCHDVPYQVVAKSGEIVDVQLSATCERDASGKLRQSVAVLVDVTERKRLEVDGSRLQGEQLALRRQAERAERQTAFLAEAGTLLSESLDYETTLKRLGELCVKELCDWCLIDVLEDGQFKREGWAHRDPAKREQLAELGRRFPPSMGGPKPIGVVAATGKSLLIPEATDELMERFFPDPAHRQALRALGSKSGMVVPLQIGNRVLGGLSLISSTQAYGEGDLALAEELARRAALAIEHARVYRESQQTRAQLGFLAEASKVLAQNLDFDETLHRVCELCTRSLADWAMLGLLGGDGFAQAAFASSRESDNAMLKELRGGFPRTLVPGSLFDRVMRSGQPVLLPVVDRETVLQNVATPSLQRAILSLGCESAMVLPLVARGQVMGALGLVSRRTERRYGPADLELARELAGRAAVALENTRLYRTAQEAVGLRDTFLMIASHELKTPLTPLKALVEIADRRLRQGGAVDATLIGRLKRPIAQLSALVEDLLDSARIDSGRLKFVLARLDLGELITEEVDAFRVSHGERTVKLELGPGPFMVKGDRARLEQVVANLLDNAAKYSPMATALRVRVFTEGAEVRFSVTDSGIGIPSEQQKRVFERFFRAANAPISRYGGLGLGLFISRDIVQGHGGRMWLESESGRGATFFVALPALGESG
ncbi:MAG: GAF domain-containing protein [Deltaproteobacteria bacterium]|nr:GAF domain-containing protein [Deltaproteobacteria bacterium]